MATQHEVIALHRKHPEWNSVDIAEALKCHPAYVRTTAKRKGLNLGPGKAGRGAAVFLRNGIGERAYEALEIAADDRGIGPWGLAAKIIRTAAEDNLFDAILDDAEARQ